MNSGSCLKERFFASAFTFSPFFLQLFHFFAVQLQPNGKFRKNRLGNQAILLSAHADGMPDPIRLHFAFLGLIHLHSTIFFLNIPHSPDLFFQQQENPSDPLKDQRGFPLAYVIIPITSQERFELPTDALEGRCSIQLSYWDLAFRSASAMTPGSNERQF